MIVKIMLRCTLLYILYILYIPGVVVIAACLESRGPWDRPSLWHSGFKGTNVSFPLTRKDSILWVASVTERYSA